jgi:chromosome segregation ATPase
MNGIVKDKLFEIKDEASKVKYAISLTQEKIELQNHNIEENKKHNEIEIQKKRDELIENQENLDKLNKDIILIQKHINLLHSRIVDSEVMEKKNKKLFQLEAKVESNIKKVKKDIEFYEQNDNCPTCRQSIEPGFKESQVNERKDKINIQQKGLEEITQEINKLNTRLIEIGEVVKHINAHGNEIVKHTSTISAITKYMAKLNKEIGELTTRKDNMSEVNAKLLTLKCELFGYNESAEKLSIDKHYYDYAATLLKDTGIKTRIIKQYLPIMNKLINKYLTAMDFFVNFNIDENFNETIKSRHRDEFSYANFSEGEKMRIDLALLFTWRQIAKLKNSTNTNLLILDEVFDSSLDVTGTEEFMKLINEIGTDTNVFVISHKGDQLFDKFRSVIKFEKYNNFSRIAK